MDLELQSFKPYYKWIVLNTELSSEIARVYLGFKPYYKWIVLNTYDVQNVYNYIDKVLNLIING